MERESPRRIRVAEGGEGMRGRKMMEEDTLRSWWATIEFPNENKRRFFYDIRALVRAVREDCAKVADQMELYTGVDVADAIRLRKGGK